jgi:glycerol uptake facilitator-like aquaporin
MNNQDKITAANLTSEFTGSLFLAMSSITPTILFTNVFNAPAYVSLLAGAITTAFLLCALIEVFSPVSGAHFNPIVTMIMTLEKKIRVSKALLYILVQIAGGITGAAAAHLMYYDKVGTILTVSDITRGGYTFFGEFMGVFVLVTAILHLTKNKSARVPLIIGFLVGGLIMSTSSTMFGNPQVTIARMFTGTDAGVRPIDGLIFVGVQIVGALSAYGVFRVVVKSSRQH